MKFYIATRFSNDTYRNQAIKLKETLEAAGHQMTFDWMNGDDLKPYTENATQTGRVAVEALDGARLADFFVLIAEPHGTGMYVEFGAALAACAERGTPKIFVLGDEKYCSMFNFHPHAQFVENVSEILDQVSS